MTDYRKFVIKDGRFIGAFEDMYKAVDDPWHQSDARGLHALSRHAAIVLMKQRGIRSVVEYGCGLGYYTEQLADAGFQVTGVDISETAIAKARARRPDLAFAVGDVTQEPARWQADAILFAEITWYLLPHLARIWDALVRERPARYFVHHLGFMKDGQQYGRELFTTVDQFIAHCPLRLLDKVVYEPQDSTAIPTVTLFEIATK